MEVGNIGGHTVTTLIISAGCQDDLLLPEHTRVSEPVGNRG